MPPDVAAADYIAGILPELIRIADQADLDLVAYLLEVARAAAAENVPAARRKR
jgi:hypothetical protein